MGHAGIFISHSHRDKEVVRRLARDLSARGAQVWLDEAVLFLGDGLTDKIRLAISETDFVLVVLSHRSIVSEWVLNEARIALEEEAKGHRLEVLPLLLENCEMPNILQGRRASDFSDPDDYGTALDLLIKRLGLPDQAIPATEGAWHRWPLPSDAFEPTRLLRLHVVCYDGKSIFFSGNRIVTQDDTQLEKLQSSNWARDYGVYVDSEGLAKTRIAHYESKSWLGAKKRLRDEGVKSGDHIVFAVGDGASEEIEKLVVALSAVISLKQLL